MFVVWTCVFISHTPRAKVDGCGATGLLISNIGNTQPHSPRGITTHWISCDYCNGSYKTPDSNNLTVPLANSSHLPRGAGRPAVLFHGGCTPLLVFGGFQHSPRTGLMLQTVHSLLAFIWSQTPLPLLATHKSGNQLDLIYTRNCTQDNILVQPSYISSDHFFITFSLTFYYPGATSSLTGTFRRNLRSLSPTLLSSVVSSSLPSPTHFTSLDVNAATDTLCSTLTSCLDNICPLSSRPARAAPSNPWLSDVLREHRTKLRAAERKWRKSNDPSDLTRYQSLLSSFSTEVHTANPHTSTTRSTALQTCVISSEHLILSSVPLHHRPPLL